MAFGRYGEGRTASARWRPRRPLRLRIAAAKRSNMVRDMSIQLEQDAQQATIYAGGAWHSAGGDALDVIDPAREVAIASVPSATPSEVHTALEAARGIDHIE